MEVQSLPLVESRVGRTQWRHEMECVGRPQAAPKQRATLQGTLHCFHYFFLNFSQARSQFFSAPPQSNESSKCSHSPISLSELSPGPEGPSSCCRRCVMASDTDPRQVHDQRLTGKAHSSDREGVPFQSAEQTVLCKECSSCTFVECIS